VSNSVMFPMTSFLWRISRWVARNPVTVMYLRSFLNFLHSSRDRMLTVPSPSPVRVVGWMSGKFPPSAYLQ
jgi:hypothetical protein